MKKTLTTHFFFCLAVLLSIESSYSQCPVTCDADVTTDQAAIYNVPEGDTHCVRTTGAITSVTFQNSVRVRKNGGALILCPEAGDTVIFEGSFLGSTGPYDPGDANIISYGNTLFTSDAIALDRTSYTNYGTLWIQNLSDGFFFRDDNEVFNYGTIEIDTIVNFNGWFHNYADVNIEGDITTSNDSKLYNYSNGNIDVTGDLIVASGSDTTWNEGTLSIHGDGAFNGNYWNSGAIYVDSLMTINAGGIVNFTGGYFVVGNLRFNSGTVTADAGGCALFIVKDSSYVASSGFAPSGVIALIDSTDNSGTGLDHEICGGSSDRTDPDDSCGLYLKSAEVNDCISSVGLPIELISFSATYSHGEVTLYWATLSEENNSHFIILRSVDGLSWSPLGTINGIGNSNSLTQYTFVDTSPPSGLVYYRLQQVDYDGTSSFSSIAAIANMELKIIILFPNPNTGVGAFSIYSSINEIMTLEVIDVLGRPILNIPQKVNMGLQTISFDVTGASKGVYFLRISSPTTGLSTFKRFEIN